MHYFDLIVDKEYKSIGKVANSCGVLPLILQNEMGTYAKGIKNISFSRCDDGNNVFVVNEGNKKYELLFNFDRGVRQTFNFYDNLYDCVVDARFILSGKNDPYLVIRVFFLEFASSRFFTIKFGKDENELSIECSENPGFDFVMSIIEVQDKRTRTLVSNMMNVLNPDYLAGKIKNLFAPTFTAKHSFDIVKK